MNQKTSSHSSARSVLLSLVAFILSAPFLSAQTAPAPTPKQKPEIDVVKFRIEPVQAPGGGKSWLRLLADFSSAPAWADGIAFYYDVLLANGSDYRVVTGVARYSNVKKGSHSAVMYMSPSAVERFGSPVAAEIRTSYKDEPSGEVSWSDPGKSPPKDWAKSFQRYPNQLLPITQTPFVATEYGKYPDSLNVR